MGTARGSATLGALLLLGACARAPTGLALPDAGRVDLARAAAIVDSAVASGAAPGAVLAVSVRGRRWFHAAGRLGESDPRRPDARTPYDLASLTKVLALTTLAAQAVDEGALALDAPASRYVPAFTGAGRERVTIRHLFAHASGLPAWRPLHREAATRAAALALADTTALDTLPGLRFAYSDLGAIVLTQAVEAALGARIDTLFDRRVARPLALRDTRYLPPAERHARIAPTEHDPWRGRLLRGEVHDENAARLDGVSGHAGLFGSARDVLRIGEAWLRAVRGADAVFRPAASAPGAEDAPPAGRSAAADFATRQHLPPGSSRALGWDTPSDGSSAGTRLAASSFGHTGFTGTSIWIDPERELVIVLLSNRVHPTRENARWLPVRRLVADAVAAALDEAAVKGP